MTDEQINAAIAAHLGITRKTGIPDFSNDLNEIHEAEKHIPDSLAHIYGNKIGTVTGAEDSSCLSFYRATARQRAEAFLRTLGKWEEGK
jgi:hypothetical protein